MLLGAGADASACTKDGLSVISLAADDEACRAVVEAQRHYEEDMEEDQVQARVPRRVQRVVPDSAAGRVLRAPPSRRGTEIGDRKERRTSACNAPG